MKIESMVTITGAEYEALRAEVERLTTSGIAEVAAHNPSVMDWMKHWEDRTLKAEAEVERLRAALEEIDMKTRCVKTVEMARAALNTQEPRT
jgi:tRNA C32,U32 (ribose-2'-O)-methylase TrmJ